MSEKIRLSESEIKNIVLEATKKILNERGFWGNISGRISDTMDNAYRGYKVKEGNPQDIEDVFIGDGWSIKTHTSNPKGEYFEVVKKTGFGGDHYGISPEDMVEELEIYLNDNRGGGKVEYLGRDEKKKYIHKFQIYK